MNIKNISLSDIKTGQIISFYYKKETKTVLVLEVNKDKKLHGFSLPNVSDRIIAENYMLYPDSTDYDSISSEMGQENYRTYFISEILRPKLLIPSDITFTKPNFEFEWGEAERYPELNALGIDGWIELASKGYVVNSSEILSNLNNIDLDFDTLMSSKKKNFYSAMRKRKIEMPIVAKFPDGYLDLVAGNTRLAGAYENNIDIPMWVVEVPPQEDVS
jgi:hypothetical protein